MVAACVPRYAAWECCPESATGPWYSKPEDVARRSGARLAARRPQRVLGRALGETALDETRANMAPPARRGAGRRSSARRAGGRRPTPTACAARMRTWPRGWRPRPRRRPRWRRAPPRSRPLPVRCPQPACRARQAVVALLAAHARVQARPRGGAERGMHDRGGRLVSSGAAQHDSRLTLLHAALTPYLAF